MKHRFHIFATFPFLLCLCVLTFNDFYLKYAFHNALTGKLSDFAGLFIFPIFWSVLFPKYRKSVYFGTALFFIFWKSNTSAGFIDWWNQWCFLGISRVVDYTDLFALISLPLAYIYEQYPAKALRVNPTFVAILSFGAFTATSPEPEVWQGFERPVLFAHQINPDDRERIEICSNEIVEIRQDHSNQRHGNSTPNIDDFEIIDSIVFIKVEGMFGYPTRHLSTVKIEEKLNKQDLHYSYINSPVDSGLLIHSLWSSQYSDLTCTTIYIRDLQKEWTIDTVLFGERQQLSFWGCWQEGPQTYFYKNGKPRLIASYHQGLEDGKWSYFLENGMIEKKEIYNSGILQKTLLYRQGKNYRNIHSLWWLTPRALNTIVWLLLLTWIIYLCFRLWELSKLAKNKWIFEGQSGLEVFISILRQLLIALFTVICTSFCSVALQIFFGFLYSLLGFHSAKGMDFFLLPICSIILLFLPTFAYLLKKRVGTEWAYFLILLIVLPLFGFQTFFEMM